MKLHLNHPTQAYACGMSAAIAALALDPHDFDQATEVEICTRCQRVRKAQLEGRLHHTGALGVWRLTPAQLRILKELSEPNKNSDGSWYFPRKNWRTLQILANAGLAKCTEENGCGVDRRGYTITQEGRDALVELQENS